ncbi:BRCT domain-containing protein [Aequorivita echinoideorum]|uniref:BRCT domain-containing protein n=1 Tax=Aequorivita echinoideorum TaxID=1549647 RepID=A0ABS5S5B0_9FLAO|nr:BRCT domain-containing protein [Aequorivita echinoideorum]MBT0607605.1 BRCT domain-containing protein [Aequorivita echinoideorum]
MGFFDFLFGKKKIAKSNQNSYSQKQQSASEMMAEAMAGGVNFKSHNDYSGYTEKSETEKAINTLRGILKGIDIDNEVNQEELQELFNWCSINKHLSRREPIKDFCINIQSVRNRGDTNELIKDLSWAVENYSDDNPYYKDFTVDIQILQGICHGILADGKINNEEVLGLQKWLDNNSQLEDYYPYYELREIIYEVLRDGVIDENEKLILKAHFKQFSNIAIKENIDSLNKEISGIKIKGYCALNPQIYIDGRKFCATGDFSRKSKEEFYSIIDDLGGVTANHMTNTTNYLIVGGKGSAAWCFSCYGRKVERAISMRNRGFDIQIVTEEDIWNFIDNQKAIN